MEGMAKQLLGKEFRESNYPGEKLSFSVAKNGKQDIGHRIEISNEKQTTESLFKEEEMLKAQLNELKKENFSLRASIKAWQLTLKNKLDEFKEADLKLNEIYNEIWSERENFCSQNDKFNDEYGISSEWWDRQMQLVSNIENLEKETIDDKKCQEIEDLEKKIQGLKGETEAGRHDVEIEVQSTEDDCFRQQEPESKVCSEEFDTKKTKSLVADDQIEVCGTESKTTKNQLFSMVDLEKVKIAKRIKHGRCKNHFFAPMKINI